MCQTLQKYWDMTVRGTAGVPASSRIVEEAGLKFISNK